MNDLRSSHKIALTALLALIPPGASAQSAGPDLGPSNHSVINQIGEAQRATIEQTNILGGLLAGSILQNGIGNNASISLEGGDLSGSIAQDGTDNQATLEIHDEHNRGAIEQYGDGNSAGLQIDGHGKDVTLIQDGNGHTYAGPIRVGGDGMGGPITIRQR